MKRLTLVMSFIMVLLIGMVSLDAEPPAPDIDTDIQTEQLIQTADIAPEATINLDKPATVQFIQTINSETLEPGLTSVEGSKYHYVTTDLFNSQSEYFQGDRLRLLTPEKHLSYYLV